MPRTVAKGFEKLSANLEITDLQTSTVSTRQKRVKAVMKEKLEVLDDFLTGSYMRSTMIAPLSEADIDIFFVLDSQYCKRGGQVYLLDIVRSALKETYTKSKVSRNGQAVTITFDDFEVDVVPAFNRRDGGYIIADAILERWITTDPKQHIKIWTKANKEHNGKLVPFIKMLKGWNKKHSKLLRSFHLECLALKLLEGYSIVDYPATLTYFFEKAQSRVKRSLPDPAGVGSNTDVGKYLDTEEKIEAVVSRLEKAYTKARQAEESVADEDIQEAYRNWGIIFGNYFPAYG